MFGNSSQGKKPKEISIDIDSNDTTDTVDESAKVNVIVHTTSRGSDLCSELSEKSVASLVEGRISNHDDSGRSSNTDVDLANDIKSIRPISSRSVTADTVRYNDNSVMNTSISEDVNASTEVIPDTEESAEVHDSTSVNVNVSKVTVPAKDSGKRKMFNRRKSVIRAAAKPVTPAAAMNSISNRIHFAI